SSIPRSAFHRSASQSFSFKRWKTGSPSPRHIVVMYVYPHSQKEFPSLEALRRLYLEAPLPPNSEEEGPLRHESLGNSFDELLPSISFDGAISNCSFVTIHPNQSTNNDTVPAMKSF